MKDKNFEFSIGSDENFNDLVADIGYDENLVAFLTQEEGFSNMRIRIFPPKSEEYWEFRLDEFEEIIGKAKARLEQLKI